jgi:maleate isomerase
MRSPGGIRSLVDLGPAVIVLAHTAVSYLNGAVGEAALAARLTKLAGTRATTAAGAVTAGLRQLGVKRLALATPYPESISAAGRAFWEASGFAIVGYHRLPDVANIYEETEERGYTLGRAADVAGAEAVLISGTGMPTAGIERLERDLGKPVVTSQQASLWRALRLAGIVDPVAGFGRLLREPG